MDRSLSKVVLNAQCEGPRNSHACLLPLARAQCLPPTLNSLGLKGQQERRGVMGLHSSLLSAFLLAEDAPQVIPQSHEKENNNINTNISLSASYIPGII